MRILDMRHKKRGPKTPEGMARSLAAFKPYQFKPGQSGNPTGAHRSAGATVLQWLNAMQDWPRKEIQAVLYRPEAPAAKVTAARCWLAACSGDHGPDFDRICDRTEGKPNQPVTMNEGLDKLTTDELKILRDLRLRMAAEAAGN